MASKPKPKLQSDFPRIASLRDDILTGAEEIADYLGWPIRRVAKTFWIDEEMQ